LVILQLHRFAAWPTVGVSHGRQPLLTTEHRLSHAAGISTFTLH
jgi:hypothetical protein